MLKQLLNDENGFIVSAEMVLVLTLCFCCTAVGFAIIRDSLVSELADFGEAIGTLDQSFGFQSISAGAHGSCAGAGFDDREDNCDCEGLTFTPAVPKADPNGGTDPEGTP